MAYDPRRDRPRHRPDDNEPSPVDSLLDGADDRPATGATDPAPGPSVTPNPADPWSDRLLYSTGISTAIGAAVGLVTLRWLWKRWVRRRRLGG